MEIRTLKLPCNGVLLDNIAWTGHFASFTPDDPDWIARGTILDLSDMRDGDPDRCRDVVLLLCTAYSLSPEALNDYDLVWLEG